MRIPSVPVIEPQHHNDISGIGQLAPRGIPTIEHGLTSPLFGGIVGRHIFHGDDF
jgi:hypothetical protein